MQYSHEEFVALSSGGSQRFEGLVNEKEFAKLQLALEKVVESARDEWCDEDILFYLSLCVKKEIAKQEFNHRKGG